MIEISRTHIDGFEAAIRGMRNPMNSWDKSDSNFKTDINEWHTWMGANDKKLMLSLVKAGPDHRKFLRMINVTMDIKAPLYWWKEFDTYKVGTVANSCSTMHKIHDKEFTLDDFSHEHLTPPSMYILKTIISALNCYRDDYNIKKDQEHWWNIIQLLPSSYNQLRTVQLNYEVLFNIYFARKDHKLDEWRIFCKDMEKLPMMESFIHAKEEANVY